MTQVALVTGASSGFGRMIAEDLAAAGLIAYASMRGTQGKNAATVAQIASDAGRTGIDLRTVELDVQDQASIDAAVSGIVREHGGIDVLIHNAGHMVWGPAEAFTPEQLANVYDINVLSTQRVNRAVLPHMRAARRGLLVWISSSSVAGGIPPLLGPYFAAKAGMDQLAVCYASELAPFGIESAIVVPGAYTKGTNHFANAGHPDDEACAEAYEKAWPAGFAEQMQEALAATNPPDADPAEIGQAVTAIVGCPPGQRRFRSVIDPADDGASVSFAVIDRIRAQFLQRIGFLELLRPTSGFDPGQEVSATEKATRPPVG